MKLAHKINVLIAFVALSLGSMAAYIAGETTAEALRTELIGQGQLISATIAEIYADDVAKNDLLPIIEGIEALVNENNQISYVYITGFDGQLVAHTFQRGFPIELLDAWAGLPNTERVSKIKNASSKESFIEVRASLIEGLTAYAYIGMSLAVTDKRVHENHRKVLSVTALLTLVLMVVGFFFSRQFTKPLAKLTDLTYRYANGAHISEDDFKVGARGSQEINKLTSAYQRMLRERASNEEKIAYLAYHDNLTKLPNLLLLRERLDQLIISNNRNQEKFAVLYMDVDNFKSINDSLGHSVGDQLLQEAATRLKSLLRQEDTIARIGGDEFIIILPKLESHYGAETTASKILESFKSAVAINSYELNVSWSIGIALFPNDGEDREQLIKSADSAMYSAKKNGKNNYQLYSSTLDAEAQERFLIEGQLRNALKHNEFEMYYQPQVSLEKPGSIQVEALIRWNHPKLGLIAPNRFIPIAEETRMMVDIGDWVMREVARQSRDWLDQGIKIDAIAFNISFVQFYYGDLLSSLDQAIQANGVPEQYFELEFTESSIMRDALQSLETMEQCVAKGFRLSIDDFGTGYSSLSQLKRLPLHKLKIDKSFVDDVPGDTDSEVVVNSIISLAQNLGLKVIAEGVETKTQQGFLAKSGCTEFQGYLYSRPLPAKEVEKWLVDYLAKDKAALIT